MALRNSEVVRRWSVGQRGTGSNLRTDGRNLYSCRVRVGTTDATDRKILWAWRGGSVWYIGHHRRLAEPYANLVVEHPEYHIEPTYYPDASDPQSIVRLPLPPELTCAHIECVRKNTPDGGVRYRCLRNDYNWNGRCVYVTRHSPQTACPEYLPRGGGAG